MELGRQLVPATALSSDELGAVLASLGPAGDGRSRLAAVVALLTGERMKQGCRGGPFADCEPNMTTPFTSGLQNCLRGPALNEPHQVNATKIRLRKQC